MTYELAGRTVLVTGASGGLGTGPAAALRAKGANLALLDLDGESVRAQALRLGGRRVAADWTADVRAHFPPRDRGSARSGRPGQG